MVSSTSRFDFDRRSARNLLCSSLRLYRRLQRRLRGAFAQALSGPLLAARYAVEQTGDAPSSDRLHRARRAARLGIGRMPQRPGLWLRTTGDGDQRLYRVRDHNGQLYATVGKLLPVAIPTARMPGYWDHVG